MNAHLQRMTASLQPATEPKSTADLLVSPLPRTLRRMVATSINYNTNFARSERPQTHDLAKCPHQRAHWFIIIFSAAA